MNQSTPHTLVLLSNASADSAATVISGGRWLIAAVATWGGGNIKLQLLGPNATYVDIPSSTISANGALAVQIPTGTYKIARTTATAIYCTMYWIPE